MERVPSSDWEERIKGFTYLVVVFFVDIRQHYISVNDKYVAEESCRNHLSGMLRKRVQGSPTSMV